MKYKPFIDEQRDLWENIDHPSDDQYIKWWEQFCEESDGSYNVNVNKIIAAQKNDLDIDKIKDEDYDSDFPDVLKDESDIKKADPLYQAPHGVDLDKLAAGENEDLDEKEYSFIEALF